MTRWKWIALGVLISARLVRPTRTEGSLDAGKDINAVTHSPADVAALLREA